MRADAFRGLGVAMVTPMLASGDIDYATLPRLVEHLIENRADFLVAMGTTAESATLKPEEIGQVVDAIRHTNAERRPLLLGCGGNDTRKVAEQMELYTRRFRPDGFLSVCPYYNKPTQEGLYQHFKTLAQSTDLPLVLYNVPGRTACDMAAETCLRLAYDFENIVAIKEASGNLEKGAQLLRDRPEGFAVLSGDDPLAMPQLAMGYDGVISVVGNALTFQFANLVHSALAGELSTARAMHLQLLRNMQLNFREGNPAGVKATMEVLGLCKRYVRLPLVPASDALVEAIQEALAVLDLNTPLPG